jgi:hypothetical protein
MGSGTVPAQRKKNSLNYETLTLVVSACRPREPVQDGAGAGRGGQRGAAPLCQGSVADLDPDPDPPDPRLFGLPGSGSISQRYGSGSGSGSFYH